MSFKTLEGAVLLEAQTVFNNPKLKLKDLMEWSSDDIAPLDSEVMAVLPELGLNVTIKKVLDKRVTG